jgi:PAS domain S-box-containing protein
MDEPEGMLLDKGSPDRAEDRTRLRAVPLGAADLYRALLESMTEGVSLSDEAGIIVYTNPAEDALFGYGPGELLGRHVSVQNAYPQEENRQRVGEVIAHLRTHGQWQGEWLNRRKDGSTFVSASRITAVNLDDRMHWLCVQRDVTAERMADAERSRAEERLRENEERLRLAASAAKIGTWDFDLVSGRGRWDEEARRIGGLNDDDDLTYDANTWLRLVHPERLAGAVRID